MFIEKRFYRRNLCTLIVVAVCNHPYHCKLFVVAACNYLYYNTLVAVAVPLSLSSCKFVVVFVCYYVSLNSHWLFKLPLLPNSGSLQTVSIRLAAPKIVNRLAVLVT